MGPTSRIYNHPIPGLSCRQNRCCGRFWRPHATSKGSLPTCSFLKDLLENWARECSQRDAGILEVSTVGGRDEGTNFGDHSRSDSSSVSSCGTEGKSGMVPSHRAVGRVRNTTGEAAHAVPGAR